MTVLRRLLPLAFFACTGCLIDVTGDGVVTVACVGDSNTEAGYLPGETGWCEQLELPATVTVRNYGSGGATFQGNVFPGGGPGCAAQTAQAIADGADIVVAACGTNNVNVQPADTWGQVAWTAVIGPTQAAGRTAYLLGIPLLDLTKQLNPEAGALFNQRASGANQELAIVAGAHWIAPPVLATTDYYPDGMHLLTPGQAKRSAAVRAVILR